MTVELPTGMQWLLVCGAVVVPLIVLALVVAILVRVTRTPRPVAAPPIPPAGWFRDPWGRHEQRFWDDTAWTSRVRDGGVESDDPPTG